MRLSNDTSLTYVCASTMASLTGSRVSLKPRKGRCTSADSSASFLSRSSSQLYAKGDKSITFVLLASCNVSSTSREWPLGDDCNDEQVRKNLSGRNGQARVA